MNTTKPMIMFSVYSSESNEVVNRTNHNRISSLLTESGIQNVDVIGAYLNTCKGKQSILLPWSRENELTVRGICNDYGQSSYLVLEANGTVDVYTPHGSFVMELGKFQQVVGEPEGKSPLFILGGKQYTVEKGEGEADEPGVTGRLTL